MSGFEKNKCFAAVLIGFIMIFGVGNVVNAYFDDEEFDSGKEARGYTVQVAAESSSGQEQNVSQSATINTKQLLINANAEHGAKLFKANCATCHNSVKGKPNLIGPNLYGVVNSKAASVNGFSYSSAMKKKSEEGLVWSDEVLFEYIASPRKYVPQTKMTFTGLKSPNDRADLIAYIKTMSDSGAKK